MNRSQRFQAIRPLITLAIEAAPSLPVQQRADIYEGIAIAVGSLNPKIREQAEIMIPMSSTLTAMQLEEASQLLSQGWKQNALASRYDVSPATLSRLMAKLKSGLGDGCAAPEAAAQAVAKSYATGPRDDHELSEPERAVVKLGMLRKRSRRLAAEMLMEHVDCTDATFHKLAAVFDKAAETRLDEQWPLDCDAAPVRGGRSRTDNHGLGHPPPWPPDELPQGAARLDGCRLADIIPGSAFQIRRQATAHLQSHPEAL